MNSKKPKLNLLVALPYMKKEVVKAISDMGDDVRFLLDSGAFTAWKSGKPIRLDDYCSFIDSLPFKPWRYFTLDVIGDPQASLENYSAMLKRGYKPLPIFTRGEKVEMIDKYYETSDVLGVGGLVGTKGNLGYVKGIMEKIGRRKVHWLGFVRHNFVNHYRPYMCDASSWSHASRNGDLKLYLGGGVIKSIRRHMFAKRPDKKIMAALASYDITPEEIRTKQFWDSGTRLNEAAARMWVRRSIESERKLGTHLFLAAASKDDIRMIREGYEIETKDWR